MRFRSRVASVLSTIVLMIGSIASASAFEGGYAGLQIGPGSFFNAPTTTPPPGIYGSLVTNYARLTIQGPGAPNINGNPTHIDIGSPVQTVLFVPGNTVLGGVYSAAVFQQENLAGAGAPIGSAVAGAHNTVVFPAILGYRLGDSGFFTKVGVGISIPDGQITGKNGLGNAGTPFVTVLGRLGVSYISNGWTFNNNNVVEYNTKNYITGYQSGIVLRDEATLTRTFGRVTLGPGINWIGQIGDDRSSAFYGNRINVNRWNQVGFGGIVSYDFGPAQLSVYGTVDVLTTASGGTPIVPGGRDTAAQAGGFAVFSTVSFRLPGIGRFDGPVDFSALTKAVQR